MYLGGKMKLLLSAFMLIACLATGLVAQDISGTIGGTILDPSGATVPSAKVTITNTDRNQVLRTITTDPSGTYSALTPASIGVPACARRRPHPRGSCASNAAP